MWPEDWPCFDLSVPDYLDEVRETMACWMFDLNQWRGL
jgi:hypothetical protein